MPTFAQRRPESPKRPPQTPAPPAQSAGGAGLLETLAVFVIVGILALIFTAPATPGSPSAVQALAQHAPQPLPGVDHHFRGCDQARAMGFENIPMGHPSYRDFMDGDGDGLACEPYAGGASSVRW